MLKQSTRAERMAKHHKRWGGAGTINLVSLMDIFTILVFFLLVNSSDGEVLPSTRNVQLPESVSEEKPRVTVVVMVTDSEIFVQGQKVADIQTLMRSPDLEVPALKRALVEQEARILRTESREDAEQREVTIMGNKDIPYALLKKVMATCTDSGFGRVSLAVLQRTPDKG